VLKHFWFYFNAIPVLVGLFFIYKIRQSAPKSKIADAMKHCKEVDNEKMLVEGTEQDLCIDNFMMENFVEVFVWTFFAMIGLIFIIPLSIYLFFRWRKYMVGHY